MKHEICPKCGVHRERKIWKHCHCGHDFEPGYVYEKTVPKPVTQSEPHWTTSQYRTFYFCLLGLVIMSFVFDRFFKDIYPLELIAGGALVFCFWMPFPSKNKRR